jgi:hypothetical protein
MMQFESIKSPTDLENYPLGTVLGGSLENYVRTSSVGLRVPWKSSTQALSFSGSCLSA